MYIFFCHSEKPFHYRCSFSFVTKKNVGETFFFVYVSEVKTEEDETCFHFFFLSKWKCTVELIVPRVYIALASYASVYNIKINDYLAFE